LTGTVVALLNTTSVTPPITVVFPSNDTSPLTGTVVGPVKTSYSDPEITVKLPGRTGTVVADGTITYGFPEIIVVTPSSGRLGFTGMVSRPVKTSNAEPEMIVMLPGKAGIVVWLGMTSNGVPETTVVLPVRPGGAFATGMDVGGMTRRGVPFTVVVLPMEDPAAGAPPITELTIEPIEVAGGVSGGLVTSNPTPGGPTGGVGVPPGGMTVETVDSVRSPPTGVSKTILWGTLHIPSVGRIDGPAGKQDERSGYRER